MNESEESQDSSSSGSAPTVYENGLVLLQPVNSGTEAAVAAATAARGLSNGSRAGAIRASQTQSRRGHFKSRLGCSNCKRRRVKCDELHPTCSPCRRLGLSCTYSQGTTAPQTVRANPTSISLEDLRFYHQFLTTAFPTLPLRAGNVWAKCAAMSYQVSFLLPFLRTKSVATFFHGLFWVPAGQDSDPSPPWSECLAHAALGLGASHLTQHGHVDYTAQALRHRISAISLINQQFRNPPKSADTADALFAALICLAAQTTLLPDCMSEYMTITRGGAMIWACVIPSHSASIFRSFTNESHDHAMTEIVKKEQIQDFQAADEFLESVIKLEALCEHPYEKQYQKHLVACIEALHTSAQQAWRAHANLWRAHCFFSYDDFLAFVKPDNIPSQLLIIHMFLLGYLLGTFCVPDEEQVNFPARKKVIISWARNVLRKLPPDYEVYGDWVKKYSDQLEEGDARYLFSP